MRVLVINDDESIRSFIVEGLEFEGYEVESVANGADALRAIERGGLPALILLDLYMPVMDGWEFARVLRARGVGVPIVCVTQASDADTAKIRPSAVLRKPFELDDLLAIVARTCGKPG